MPAYVKAKYTKEQTAELKLTALSVLQEAKRALTIDEICASDMTLTYQTSQKMARVLSDLVEAGFVKKAKSKSKGKMVYAAVACLEKQGYSMEGFVC